MVIKRFPPIEFADENGLLAVGGDVEVDSLLLAYRSGIFPWPFQEGMLTWFSPPKRAVLHLDDFQLSRSMRKFIKKHNYTIAVNRDFREVIRRCQSSPKRIGQEGTWITDELIRGYLDLHENGYAHSVECYDGDELIAGLYGVSLGSMFAGESMFHEVDNTSKLCFSFLVEWMKKRGGTWIDCQVLTPLTSAFGAIEIERGDFLKLLPGALRSDVVLFEKGANENVLEWRGEEL